MNYSKNTKLNSKRIITAITAVAIVILLMVLVAADLDVLPYGTEVYILGHKYTVQDKGGAVTGSTIDIYFENHQDAVDFGVQYQDVYLGSEVETDD